jgi:hypothetical protein
MNATRLRSWTVVQWGNFAHRGRDVRDRIDRAIRELPETAGLTPRHVNLLIKAHGAMWGVLMAIEHEFARQHPDRDHEAIRLAHGESPNVWAPCRGRVRKGERKLSRDEWREWGERLKAIDRDVSALFIEFHATAPKARARRFQAVFKAMSRARCALDGLVCRQHPDWPEATRVFYGTSLVAAPPSSRDRADDAIRWPTAWFEAVQGPDQTR